MGAPTKAGFYWAKWRIAEDGSATAPMNDGTPDMGWEVVEVWDNSNAVGEDGLLVSVAGEARSQRVENFVWGPGPLDRPSSPAASEPCDHCDGRGWIGGTKQTPKSTCPVCRGSKARTPSKPRLFVVDDAGGCP